MMRLSSAATAVWLAVVAACAGDPSSSPAPGVYVQAGADDNGQGTASKPFASLADASAAADGDTIFVLASGSTTPLDGGIALAPGQKLIGLDSNGNSATDPADMPRLTNSTEHLDGTVVQLSEGNEVSGLHLVDLQSHGITSATGQHSGTRIHHLAFSGAAESEEIIFSIELLSASAVTDVVISDSQFSDGEDLGGIHVLHTGDSTGDYRFERNRFSALGGRAYHVQTVDTARIDARILDSSADNIGRGERNSDSILPHLSNRSEQSIVVRNYRYKNSGQVGNQSNCGLEAFIMGPPFQDDSRFCTGCKLRLEITDSVFEQPVTDGIQLINFGSNTVLDVAIRNTRIVGANPQQVGGGLSLLAQNEQNSGSRTTLLVENSDITGSAAYGFAASDQGEGNTATIDLGGGELGSAGNNRITGSASGEIQLINSSATAKNNWWGGTAPRVDKQGSSDLVAEPALAADPGPASQ